MRSWRRAAGRWCSTSLWRPLLAGAVGAALVIAAVAIAQPRFTTREVIVDHVVQKDTPVDHLVPHDTIIEVPHIVTKDVEIPIPRVVETAPALAPRSREERALEGSEAWRGADVRGGFLRADKNGFDLVGEDGSEIFFSPAKIGPGGKIEPDEGVKDVVTPYLSDLAYCRPSQIGTYLCVALHEGKEVPIPQVPIIAKRGRPA